MLKAGETPTAEEVAQIFSTSIRPKLIDLKTGNYVDGDANTFDQMKASKDPEQSVVAPANLAKIPRLPNKALVYQVVDGDAIKMVVLPVEGKGLWSTLYGFLALDKDVNTIKGLTFYQHAETPGLGGEVDNPKWKALWPGRKAFDEAGKPKIEVIKGQAGPVAEDPYRVDGLSGSTITARGVSHLVQFWLGNDGFGPYLKQFKERGT